jgi:DNA-binding PadR family transcriptional regulator
MKPSDIPVLGYALLGLIHQKPSSGYDLRKTFAETALGNYSSSPGAIYPALERLQARGFVGAEVQETTGLRRRRLFTITQSGEAALKQWLGRPIARQDVTRGAAELMLRFAFMEQVLGVQAAVDFLQGFRTNVESYIPELKAFLEANEANMPLSGRLALESGVRGYETSRDWAEYAIQTYRQAQSKSLSTLTKPNRGGS